MFIVHLSHYPWLCPWPRSLPCDLTLPVLDPCP